MLLYRTFGCVAFVHMPKTQRTKLDPCAVRDVFLGYATHQKGYRCYYLPTQRTYVTMDVIFLESEMYFTPSSNFSLQGEIGNEEHNWTDFFFLTIELETTISETTEPISTLVSPMASEYRTQVLQFRLNLKRRKRPLSSKSST